MRDVSLPAPVARSVAAVGDLRLPAPACSIAAVGGARLPAPVAAVGGVRLPAPARSVAAVGGVQLPAPVAAVGSDVARDMVPSPAPCSVAACLQPPAVAPYSVAAVGDVEAPDPAPHYVAVVGVVRTLADELFAGPLAAWVNALSFGMMPVDKIVIKSSLYVVVAVWFY